MTDYNTSLDLVTRLVKQFRTNLAAYHASDYRQAHARQDLIDPLFIALGWDVHNENHVAPVPLVYELSGLTEEEIAVIERTR